jgi:hypothetical protein
MPATYVLDAYLKRIHDYYLESLTCEHTALVFACDWPGMYHAIARVIRRVGVPLWFVATETYGPLDDTPFVVASLDEPTGLVNFRAASVEDLAGCRAAAVVDWCGYPVEP